MKANHLVIGLGGTGVKIIRSLRKTIFQEFRKLDADSVDIEYLYVDSSEEMMAVDDPSWKLLGTSVQLDKKSHLVIGEQNLAARLDNINEFPGIKPWIGNPEQWRDILGSIVGKTLGGQKRRLGRFLFACKAADYRNQVQSLVRDLQSSGIPEVTFHVVCGLAGGTGSGSVIDALAQVRDLYPDSKRYRILLYALLPETYPNPNWDTGNYHANGYAALLELNALGVGAYKPVDITGAKPDRLNVSDPFNGAYVFTTENENGLTVDVDKEIPNIVADFLYQKIVAVGGLNWPTLGRMENAENGDGTPEKSPGSNTAERSKRFLTFGIKRLAYPEEEVSEYLTYNFAKEAALQLRFNNWSDTSGFTDEPRNADYTDFVRQKETLQAWALTDENLTLSLGILPEDVNNKRWKPINNEWQEVIPNFKTLVRERKQETWLAELQKLCEKRFEQDYRGLGVRNFYQSKLRAKREHAREIRRRVENDMFTEWRNGIKSTFDISRLLSASLEAADERLKAFDSKIVAAKNNEDDAAKRVVANNHEWSHVGLVGKMIGKPENLLNAQGDTLFEQYAQRTWIEAWTFAKQLMAEVISELTDLKAEVDRATSTIADALKRYNERIGERVAGKKNGADLREQMVKFYNPDLVRSVTSALVKDENEQKTQANRVRLALITRIGDNPNFSLFNQRIGAGEFLDILDKESASNARIAHNNLIQNPKERMLGVNIIERLKERYSGNQQELRTYLTELVARAGNFVSFDQSEMDKDRGGAQTGVRQMTVMLPKAADQAEFAASLKTIFRGANANNVEFVETDARPSEIVMVSLTNLFPLRFVRQLGFLRQKYDLRVSGANAARIRTELHGEGDGTQFPRLFIPAQSEVNRGVIPFLLLAKALKLVQTAANPETGAQELVIVAKDEHGFDTDPIYLGKSFSDSTQKLDRRSADLIRDYVQKLLGSRECQLDARRAELQQAVVADVEAIKVERGGNIQDDAYKQFLEGGRKAVSILKREI